MGVYTRFKRDADGFRALVELLETTPIERRKRMIEVGMAEDAEFTERALQFVMSFEDLTLLPDEELAELMAVAPPRTIAYAINNLEEPVKARFIKCAKSPVVLGIRDYLDAPIGLREIGGARLKLVEKARELEKKGFIRTKRIPVIG